MNGHIEEQLTSYLLGDLDKAAAAAVQAHLESCESCRAVLEEIKPTLDALRTALAAGTSAPRALTSRRRQRIRAVLKPQRRRFIGWMINRPHAALARIAAVLVIGFILVALLMPGMSKSRVAPYRVPMSAPERDFAFAVAGPPDAVTEVASGSALTVTPQQDSEGAGAHRLGRAGGWPDSDERTVVGYSLPAAGMPASALQPPPPPPDLGVALSGATGVRMKKERGMPSPQEAKTEPGLTLDLADGEAREEDKVVDRFQYRADPFAAVEPRPENEAPERSESMGFLRPQAERLSPEDMPTDNDSRIGDSVETESRLAYGDGRLGEKDGGEREGKEYSDVVLHAKGFGRGGIAGGLDANGPAQPPGVERKPDEKQSRVAALRTVMKQKPGSSEAAKAHAELEGMSVAMGGAEADGTSGDKGGYKYAAAGGPPASRPTGSVAAKPDTAELGPLDISLTGVYASRAAGQRTSPQQQQSWGQGQEEIGARGKKQGPGDARRREDLRDREIVASRSLTEVTNVMLVDAPALANAVAYDEVGAASPGAYGEQIDHYIQTRNYEGASKLLAQLFMDYPDAPFQDVMSLKATLLAYRAGDYATAYYRCTRLIEEYPESPTTQKARELLPRIAAAKQAAASGTGPKPSRETEADAEAMLASTNTFWREWPAPAPRARAAGVNPFLNTAAQAVSTFGIDVDTAAYTLLRGSVAAGKLPPPEAVRTEEFVNFFDYDYNPPANATFAVYAEIAPSPFGRGLHLLKLGIKGRRIGREERRQAALTFVIDTSGSMNTPERLGLVKKSLRLLVTQLDAGDRVAIVQYDNKARLVLDHTPAAEAEKILAAIDQLQTSGSTNLEEGMGLGYEVAARGFVSRGENRVLLLSDGMANLGSVEALDILDKAETFRAQGVRCSVLGFGHGSYNDAMLEALADKGDGAYTFIDSEEEARRVFVEDLSAQLNTIAGDTRIQVEFNPRAVARYRQLGYENRQMTREQFRDDESAEVKALSGEVGSGQSVTALYELELPAGPIPGDGVQAPAAARPPAAVAGLRGPEPFAVVRVRYRSLATGQMEEIERPINADALRPALEAATARFRLAACAAEFSEILRGSPHAAGGDFAQVAQVLRPVALDLGLDRRVQELLQLVQAAQGMPRATP